MGVTEALEKRYKFGCIAMQLNKLEGSEYINSFNVYYA